MSQPVYIFLHMRSKGQVTLEFFHWQHSLQVASGTIRHVLFVTPLSIGWLLLVYGLPGTGSSIALPLLSSVCLSLYPLGCLSVCQSKPNSSKEPVKHKENIQNSQGKVLTVTSFFLPWQSFYIKHYLTM